MDRFHFHPVITNWFQAKFGEPTEPQEQGWPQIAARKHTLIAAPTGSGKTLSAFLACIDRLFRMAVENQLEDGMKIVYVSPLRALSNDMHRNLTSPLEEIRSKASEMGVEVPEITVGLRTGDTTPSQRQAIVKRPPHILVTTPESLYLLLTAERGRAALSTVDTLIVDEIHALVRDKRGSHLSLTMERLEALVEHPIQRIGLSATQKPIDKIARFLVGNRNANLTSHNFEETAEFKETAVEKITDANSEVQAATEVTAMQLAQDQQEFSQNEDVPCQIIDIGHQRQLDLGIEIPPSEIGAVCTHEQWAEVNLRLVEMINSHRSTLLFVNTRRMAERVTHQLTELLGEDSIGSHHGLIGRRYSFNN